MGSHSPDPARCWAGATVGTWRRWLAAGKGNRCERPAGSREDWLGRTHSPGAGQTPGAAVGAASSLLTRPGPCSALPSLLCAGLSPPPHFLLALTPTNSTISLVCLLYASPVPPRCPLLAPLVGAAGHSGLPGAGSGEFSLMRHPCQKHLVYKLAVASSPPSAALGSRLTGLRLQALSSLPGAHGCPVWTPGCPPMSWQECLLPTGRPGLPQDPDPDLARVGHGGLGMLSEVCGGGRPRPSTWIYPKSGQPWC